MKSILKNKKYLPLILIFAICSCTKIKKDHEIIKPVIDEKRLTTINIECINPDDGKIVLRKLNVLDIYKDSVEKIFTELKNHGFTLFDIGCYNPRKVIGRNIVSIHAYAAAIDVNPKQNPFFNKYSKEVEKNRSVYVNGMITEKEIEIFAKHGFTVWGGKNKRPDFMHFQVPSKLAVILGTVCKDQSYELWNMYIKNPAKISADEYFEKNIPQAEVNFHEAMERIKLISVNKKVTNYDNGK